MFKNISKILYILASLVLAVLLAIYVDGQTGTNSASVDNVKTASKTDLLHLNATKTVTMAVPLKLKGIDVNNYLISGTPDTVEIKLTGPSALVTSTENTKGFQVVADLSDLADGEHTVALKVTGLNKELTYKLTNPTLTLTVYKKSVATYNVQLDYNKDAIAEGYVIGDVENSVTSVQVIGRKSAVQAVDRVVAVLQLSRDTTETVEKDVQLQAVDADGNPVDVALSENTTHVKIPVEAGKGTKKVKLVFDTSGGDADKYTIKANVNEFELTGNMDKLKKISDISIKVDLTDITTAKTETVQVPLPAGVDKIDTSEVTITIEPKTD
ncbi:MAG: hypothetical protein LBT80_02350 [Lactobacillaceae bacterium]|jgi:YbbR domain-containing protein|nr:hypothetical protein [Lactobacillaceae bacterium]